MQALPLPINIGWAAPLASLCQAGLVAHFVSARANVLEQLMQTHTHKLCRDTCVKSCMPPQVVVVARLTANKLGARTHTYTHVTRVTNLVTLFCVRRQPLVSHIQHLFGKTPKNFHHGLSGHAHLLRCERNNKICKRSFSEPTSATKHVARTARTIDKLMLSSTPSDCQYP